MWELGYKESWVLKNWCFRTVVLEKNLESPLNCKEIQVVHPKGDRSWVFFGRTDVDAEILILWPPDAKSWLIWKYPDAGEDWGQEKKGTTEDEMVGWNHWHNGHGFGWTPGVGDGQGGLAYCCSWGRKESDTTEQLNWTDLRGCFMGVVPYLDEFLLYLWGGWRSPCLTPLSSSLLLLKCILYVDKEIGFFILQSLYTFLTYVVRNYFFVGQIKLTF